MNKDTTIINNAKQALNEYYALREDMRGGGPQYNHKNWHAVNVKRTNHNDYMDIDDIIKNPAKYKEYFYVKDQAKSIKKYADCIKEKFNSDYIDQVYFDWLDDERDQLFYELSDITNITGRQTFRYIADQGRPRQTADESYVLFLGRCGGWACFQDTAEDTAEELQDFLEDTETQGLIEEIKESTTTINQAIKDIEDMKSYIKKFNNNIAFPYEMLYRIAELIEEEEQEEESLAQDKDRLLTDTNNLVKQLITRLNQFRADKSLKSALMRNVKSIQSIINKNL